MTRTAGATFATDDAGSLRISGAGPLAAVAGFGFGGPDAPYAVVGFPLELIDRPADLAAVVTALVGFVAPP